MLQLHGKMVAARGTVDAEVRIAWEDKVADGKAWDASPSSSVSKAVERVKKEWCSGLGNLCDTIDAVICSSKEWKKAHRSTVASAYESLTGRVPNNETLDALEEFRDTDTIVSKIWQMHQRGDHADDPPSNEPPVSAESADTTPSEETVDFEWIDRFRDAFDREPFVYEYVRLRKADSVDIGLAAERHRAGYAAMNVVHVSYLGSPIEEAKFVREYVDELQRADTAERLVAPAKAAAIASDKYREEMQSRLSSVHETLFGTRLHESDARFLFERTVRGAQVPLNADLSTIVSAYVSEGEKIDRIIDDAYKTHLGRHVEPGDDAEKLVMQFRVDPAMALKDLRGSLSSSMEFFTHVSSLIKDMRPVWRTSEVFRAMKHIGKLREDLDSHDSLIQAVSDLLDSIA